MSGEKAKLSDEQWEIVSHPVDKHAVVLAVAGSGKSTTLAERIAYLFEAKNVAPAEIITVMFNRSAALDMTDKLHRRLGKRNAPDAITYHRLGTLTLKLLERAGLAPKWTFDASPSAAAKFATEIITPFFFANKNGKYPHLAADAFLSFVDRVKSDLADPDDVFESGEWSAKKAWFPAAYNTYELERKKRGLRFFSDLIYDPITIVRENEKAASIVANRYAHVIVDEYQDICESQQALIRIVAGSRARVMVVGDDDQTIYTWRGANPSYILRDFERDFGGATVYKLSRTWRYGHNLSCAANYLITNNKDRAEKLCVSGAGTPKTQVRLVQGNPYSVIKVMRPLIKAGLSYGRIAVLVRAYARSGTVQLELLKYGIPFRLEGGEKVAVLENPWVKLLIGWMAVGAKKIAARPYAGEPDFGSITQLKDVINNMWLRLPWEKHNLLCKSVLSKPTNGEGFSFFTNNYLEVNLANRKDDIALFATIWRSVQNMNGLNGVSPHAFMLKIMTDLNVENKINGTYEKLEDAEMHNMLVLSFIEYAKQFKGSAVDFLQHVADLKSFSDEAKKSVEAVHITSIHRSKGLEWDAVFMIGLVQGQFPLAAKKKEDSLKAQQRIEDERRLFYVGMTRARYFLYLVAPLDNGVKSDLDASLDLDRDYVAPVVDGTLMIRLKGGGAKSPYSLEDYKQYSGIMYPKDGDDDDEKDAGKEKVKLPSQFLYEANILASNMMSDFICSKTSTLKGANAGLFNAYLEAVGSKKRMSHLKE